jgi:hypothetical protein
VLRVVRSRYWRLPIWDRPPTGCLHDLLTANECAALALSGHALRGCLARFVLEGEGDDPEDLSDDDLARLLRALRRRPDVVAALRRLLSGGAAQ